MRHLVSAALLAAASLAGLAATAAVTPAAAASAPYSTAETDLGTLLDDPASKAILDKYLPTLIASPQIDMARGMTLKQLQGFAAD